jgi:hypothetical protein
MMESIKTPVGAGPAAANDCPPVALGTTEGRCIDFGSDAEAQYVEGGANGNPSFARKYGQNTRWRASGGNAAKTVYRASTGFIWAFTGKIGRVLQMLATEPDGVTQWDCWPWHTRLGASIHALREAGLEIETQREGDCRHARYFLRTPGRLILQAENSGGGQ